MQSAQAFLTVSFYIVWYGFCLLFMFDFLSGLPALMQAVQLKRQQVELRSLKSTCEELPDADIVASNFEETTRQYLEMVGVDIDDFESVGQARQFLDEHAPWTIETEAQSSFQSILPDPWFEPVKELPQVAVDESLEVEPFPIPKLATSADEKIQAPMKKLTFDQVQEDFACLGWKFQKHRSGHYRYRVSVSGSTQRFKTLQEALDWLVANKPITKDTAYLTRQFVRQDCGIHGAELSDEDCDVIIAEVQLLAKQEKFNHSGVYWIANRLAAEGRIRITLPKNVN